MATASLEGRQLLRVGDLAARTGASPRMLRYYENQGLIEAERSSSGQRLFEPSVADQVRHIRMLLAAGLPTRVIGELRGCPCSSITSAPTTPRSPSWSARGRHSRA